MSGRELDHTTIRKLTNLDELIGPQQEESAPVVPSQPELPSTLAPKRSTTDAFESNFGTVDIVGGFDKRGVKPAVRWFAWIFFAAPAVLPFLMFAADFLNLVQQGASTSDRLWAFGLTVVSGLYMLFWPWILLKKPAPEWLRTPSSTRAPSIE